MKTFPFSAWAATFLAALAFGQPALKAGSTQTVVNYPAGTILENIAVSATGDLFVTAIDSGTIFQVAPVGLSRVFAQVQGPLLGLAFDADGMLYAVGGTSVYRCLARLRAHGSVTDSRLFDRRPAKPPLPPGVA